MTRPLPIELQSAQPNLEYKVRFNDCDPMGHLNNSRYIDYFVNAMEDFLYKNYKLNLADELKKGFGWVVRDHQIMYITPVSHHQTVAVKVEFVRVRENEFEVEMQMFSESKGQIHALIRSNFSCFDVRKKRRAEHPENVFFAVSNAINPDLAFSSTLGERFQAIRMERKKSKQLLKKYSQDFRKSFDVNSKVVSF